MRIARDVPLRLRSRSAFVIAWTALGAATLPMGCGDSSGTHLDCVQGNAACICYQNMTCNQGLVCVNNLCVAPGSGTSSSGGAGSSSGNGTINGNGGRSSSESGLGGEGSLFATVFSVCVESPAVKSFSR